MPPIEVRVFRKATGVVPLKGWLDELKRRERKVYAKCLERIIRLAELGHDINKNRTWSAYLRDGIYELRVSHRRVNYRILYSFVHQNKFACLSHGLTKEAEVPPIEIERAIENMNLVKGDPDTYTATFET